MPKIDIIRVKIKTSDYKAEWNLLDTKNLDELGITADDIKDAIPTFFAVPGYVYEEVGVAGPYHPTAGSCGCEIITYDERHYGIQEIMYHDRGHRGGMDPPHWNHERRYLETTDLGQRELKRTGHVNDHIIPDSPYIEWSMNPGPGNNPVKKRVIRPTYK